MNRLVIRRVVTWLLTVVVIIIAAAITYGQDADAASYIERGTQRWHRADYEGAISSYTSAIEADEALLKTGKATDADVKRVSATYLLRARVRRILRRFDESLDDISHCISLRPQLAEAYFEQGYTYLSGHNRAAAIASYTRAIELDPAYAEAYRNRGFALQDGGDAPGGLADFDKSIELNPKDSQTYFFRGMTRHAQRDYRGALQDFNKMIELVPDDAMGYKLRAGAWIGLGRKQEAERDLAKYMDLRPDERATIEEILKRVRTMP